MSDISILEKPYQVMFETRVGKEKTLALFISQDPEKSIENISKAFFEAAIRNLSDAEKQLFFRYLKSLSVEERQEVLSGIYCRMISNSCSKQSTNKRKCDANE